MPFQDLALYQGKKNCKTLFPPPKHVLFSSLFYNEEDSRREWAPGPAEEARGVIRVVSGPIPQQEPCSSAKGWRASAKTN